MLLYLCLVGQNVSRERFLESIRSIETKRVYSIYLKKYPENYNLTVTDPRTIEGMLYNLLVKHRTNVSKVISSHIVTI